MSCCPPAIVPEFSDAGGGGGVGPAGPIGPTGAIGPTGIGGVVQGVTGGTNIIVTGPTNNPIVSVITDITDQSLTFPATFTYDAGTQTLQIVGTSINTFLGRYLFVFQGALVINPNTIVLTTQGANQSSLFWTAGAANSETLRHLQALPQDPQGTSNNTYYTNCSMFFESPTIASAVQFRLKITHVTTYIAPPGFSGLFQAVRLSN